MYSRPYYQCRLQSALLTRVQLNVEHGESDSGRSGGRPVIPLTFPVFPLALVALSHRVVPPTSSAGIVVAHVAALIGVRALHDVQFS